MNDDEPIGLAQLPHLTASELAVLLGAVDAQRMRLMAVPLAGMDAAALANIGEEMRVLWSLSTAVSEALIAAQLDARRRSAS